MSQVVAVEIARRILEARTPEERTKIAEELAGRLREARAELSRKIREFWSSPEGTLIKELLTEFSQASGFASGMTDIMGRVAPEIKTLASRTNIDAWYTLAWGKTLEARRKFYR